MNDKENLTKKFIMVDTDEILVSTQDKPIIGTEDLGPCIGFILYSEEEKKAIVGHVSRDQLLFNESLSNMRFQISSILDQNNLFGSPLDLTIIEGAYKSEHLTDSSSLDIFNPLIPKKVNAVDIIEENIKSVDFINVQSIKKDDIGSEIININGMLSKQFAFDASTGQFVTDKVLFGIDYINANKKYE